MGREAQQPSGVLNGIYSSVVKHVRQCELRTACVSEVRGSEEGNEAIMQEESAPGRYHFTITHLA